MDLVKQIASVSNDLVLHAKYKLTATEQKLILFMASLIKPDDVDFTTRLIPFKEIERLFNQDGKKWGNIYAYLDSVLDSLTTKTIVFDTKINVDGVNLKGRISWVASAVPQYDEKGKLCIEFEFSKKMKPFFLELKKNFTKYQIQDIINMNSPNAIRLYQILKTHKDKQSQYRDIAVVSYQLDDLKFRLGLDEQKAYKQYGNFKNRVLKTAQKQLETNTHIRFEFKEKKIGRKVNELIFTIYNNLPKAKEELITLFNQEKRDGIEKKELEEFFFKKIAKWGINRDNIKRIVKHYSRAYIEEKIAYTKKMERLGKIQASKASFFFGALKDDYKDEVFLKKKEEQAKKKVIVQKDKNKKQAQQQHQKNMETLRSKLFELHPTVLEKALEKVKLKGVLGYNRKLSITENYQQSPIFKAAVHNLLEELYPKHFEKEKQRYKKVLEGIN